MSTTNEQAPTNNTESSSMDKAIVIDLGKKKRKDIKRLRKGRGKIIDQVEDHINELRSAGAISEPGPPVIVVVSEKKRKMRWM